MAPVLLLQVLTKRAPALQLPPFDHTHTAAAASVELKTERLDVALDFCQMVCDTASLPVVQALVTAVSSDFLKRKPPATARSSPSRLRTEMVF